VSTIRHRNTSVALALAVVTLPSLLLASDLQTHRFVLPAATAFEDGQGAHAVMLNDSGAVVLYNRVLIEDDGPGMGSDADWLKTDRAPTTEISGDTRVMKTLHIDRLGAFEAQLIAPPGVRIELNGHDLAPSSNSPTLEIPPSLLKEGDNEVVLSSLGGKGQTIKIAPTEDILRNNPERKNWPQRSFESTNAGKTWEPIHGEYMVRGAFDAISSARRCRFTGNRTRRRIAESRSAPDARFRPIGRLERGRRCARRLASGVGVSRRVKPGL
jgi:hypothetical protein